MIEISFSQMDQVTSGPGLYEVHTVSGIKLKVGTGSNLKQRLQDHRASRQSGLKLKPGGDRSQPQDVVSKKSILAKHLYYDEAIAPEYDLKTEAGRRDFLMNSCVVFIQPTTSLLEARRMEKKLETSGAFRYVGDVRIRRE